MLKFLFILIYILSFTTIHAQQVTNIQVSQEGDNVAITYDISNNKAGQTFDIKVEYSTDNGKTFSITPLTLTGDLKEVLAGTGKRIIWDVLSEMQELSGDQFVFQLEASNSGITGTFIDGRDGKVYKWVRMGSQIWMAENLKASKYRNGKSIPNVPNNIEWENLTTPGYCWYDNEAVNKNIYGTLYNWYATYTGKLAPIGWHIPSDAEWTMLITYLGDESVAGGKLKEIGTSHWKSPNVGATNETLFTALPDGYRYQDGSFVGFGNYGIWWSSTEGREGNAWGMGYLHGSIGKSNCSKEAGYSVRCVKD